MDERTTRRDVLLSGLAAAGILALPTLGQSESEVPFLDIPSTFNPNNPNSPSRMLDIRKIDGLITPKDQFFALQHFDKPELDAATFRVKFTGLVNKPAEFSLADLRAMKASEEIVGYECSGNSGRSVQALSSCGRFTGVRLSSVLRQLGVHPKAREVVFFGADHGVQDVVFRQQTFKTDQQYGRSMALEYALKPEPLLAYALNGEPLRREHGFPVRLIVPGWYGVANVKWLSEVRLQEDRYLGNYQARWYRSLRGTGGSGELTDPQTQWVENEVTRMRLKSVIAQVKKKSGDGHHEVLGFVLNDGTPLKSVEVQVDGGAWQKAVVDRGNTHYSWKLFRFRWEGATAGEHTLVSRVTDVDGNVQPTADELSRKKTFLEDNSQYPRKVKIG